MILTQDNEYAVLLDACVLVPMPLADTLLRLAEDPALYRPLWSEGILQEVGTALERKLNHTSLQRERRIGAMKSAFPEASVEVPTTLIQGLTCIPDENDRHVLAAAIKGQANAVITLNSRHFPTECLQQYDLVRQTPDDFLVHQIHLNPDVVLEKLDAQAAAMRQVRKDVIERLAKMVPNFAKLALEKTS